MGKMKNFHYTMKDKEDWTDKDWEMYFEDLRTYPKERTDEDDTRLHTEDKKGNRVRKFF
jgi:hypothetical protein